MKVYVFGVGKGKDNVRDCLREDVSVEKYVDNNEQLWGQKIDGVEITGPDKIDETVDIILISVMYFYHIYYQLIRLGIDRKKILPFYSLKMIRSKTFWKLVRPWDWMQKVIPYYFRRIKRDWKRELSPFWKAHVRAQIKFWEDQGDNVLRFAYDLNQDSVVFDLGGYVGEFAQEIVDKYDCYVYIFEPVSDYAEKIRERFQNSHKVKVYNFGLEEKNSKEILYMHNDGSSVYKNKDAAEKVEIEYRCISEFLKENDIKNINLMKVNIEGGEYSLMEHLIKTGEIHIIENLQIQFHNIKKLHARRRQKAIRNGLEKTHELLWSYRPFVFDSWKRKCEKS